MIETGTNIKAGKLPVSLKPDILGPLLLVGQSPFFDCVTQFESQFATGLFLLYQVRVLALAGDLTWQCQRSCMPTKPSNFVYKTCRSLLDPSRFTSSSGLLKRSACNGTGSMIRVT